MNRNPHMKLTAFSIASLAVMAMVFAHPANASPSLWSEVDTSKQTTVSELFMPQEIGRVMRLDHEGMRKVLTAAPIEIQQAVNGSGLVIGMPRPEGGFGRYRVVETQVMHPDLAARYPSFKTYLAQDIDDPSVSARIDLTNVGFRAQFISPSATSYIEPRLKGDLTQYVVFNQRDDTSPREPMRCEVTGQPLRPTPNALRMNLVEPLSTNTIQRTYRLAVATTGEYTSALGGTVAGGMSAVVTKVNRVNGIFERELAIRFQLVANNDVLIFTNAATDPYSNADAVAMLQQNQSTLDALIGNANYDVGHVFKTEGGGNAAMSAACTEFKAWGVIGTYVPRADWVEVMLFAHELGHQMNASHSFNSAAGICLEQIGSTVEPGSGSTIMSYASACGTHNTQVPMSGYFHAHSLSEIEAFVSDPTGGGACGTALSIPNLAPTLSVSTSSYTIPALTPFSLIASAIDPEGDTVSYTWEQMDQGPLLELTDPVTFPDLGAGPLFRSFPPSPSPRRYFPSLPFILDHANEVPVTIPGVVFGDRFVPSPSYELLAAERLPTTSRKLNFRVTARDNRSSGGAHSTMDVIVAIEGRAGPFRVTAPNSAVTWTPGTMQTVTWDVAGTAGAPIYATHVEIALSLDGGYTFPVIIASSAPNTGSATVLVPTAAKSTQRARIRVSAVGNIFFDIGDTDFTIASANTPPTISLLSDSLIVNEGGVAVTAPIADVSDTEDQPGSLSVSVANAPSGLSAAVRNENGRVVLTLLAACGTELAQTLVPLLLTVTDSAGASTASWVSILVYPNLLPSLGTYSDVSIRRGDTYIAKPSSPLTDDSPSNLSPLSLSMSNLPGSGAAGRVAIVNTGSIEIATTATTQLGKHVVRATATDICGAVVMRDLNVLVIDPGPFISGVSAALAGGLPVLQANQSRDIMVSLQNSGNAAATNVNVSLVSKTAGVTVTQANAQTANINAGGSRTIATPLRIATTETLVCGEAADFDAVVSHSGANSPRTFPVRLLVGGAGSIFSEGFDATTGPALPPGWFTTQSEAGLLNSWTLTSRDAGANRASVVSVPAVAGWSSLVSPPISLPEGPTGAVISFVHQWSFEQFDAAVLEVSLDGGQTYYDATAAEIGATFQEGEYQFEIPTGPYAFAGKKAWGGGKSDDIRSTLALPAALNGRTIQLRFRAGWDGRYTRDVVSWTIDSLLVSVGAGCVAPPYKVNVTATNLVGVGLFVQTEGAGVINIRRSGQAYRFGKSYQSGDQFDVVVVNNPNSPSQTCNSVNGAGRIEGHDVSVQIECVDNPYFVTTNVIPAGLVPIICVPNPVAAGGTTQCIQADASPPGLTLARWTGDCTGRHCFIENVRSAKSVTAIFESDSVLNIDGSVAPERYTVDGDGVLLLRYLLGFRGEGLVRNVKFGAGATRTNPAEIETFIAANLYRFDIDDDGAVLAHTDGVMIFRRLSGILGAALTQGANNSGQFYPAMEQRIDQIMQP